MLSLVTSVPVFPIFSQCIVWIAAMRVAHLGAVIDEQPADAVSISLLECSPKCLDGWRNKNPKKDLLVVSGELNDVSFE